MWLNFIWRGWSTQVLQILHVSIWLLACMWKKGQNRPLCHPNQFARSTLIILFFLESCSVDFPSYFSMKYRGFRQTHYIFFCMRTAWQAEGVQPPTKMVPTPLAPTQLFSCVHCEIFKNIYFEEHLRTAASNFHEFLRIFQKFHNSKITFTCEFTKDNFNLWYVVSHFLSFRNYEKCLLENCP